ncbi:MAG: phosphocholine cytidylyltransferase family protein [Gammaproteobacteria bacterium]|nr:phosphocholine cytidylyltransferase family protein [Gammaproteobacteria bacterium]MDH5304857.1 phosphocholine cytidylyltransferase family protein [Gammaproteobacteria bacterium]MDH5323192.1 phosphocholine cytidylyltransferase family protein [Gammaproteobacteria bacterium]
MIRTAVILAAGIGSRLGGELTDRPKGFLQLGDRPIIEESLARLVQAGIRKIFIVTGHRAEYYESLRPAAGVSLTTVHNPEYAASGSMYSLYCARQQLRDAFLLLESDLIYEPRALAELLRHPADDAVLVSGPTGAGDEVWVATRGGRLSGMSKQADSFDDDQQIVGELVGISKISPALFRIMLRVSEAAFENSLRYDYETGALVAAAQERAIACPLIADLAWSEIDDPSHLRRARDIVYPEIRRRAHAGVEQQ